MSNAKKYTPAEAQAWVESREWANGWNINTDSTVNAVEFANQYAANKELWDKLFTFLAENDLNTLPASKHVLVEGKCWVNIMEYTPKPAQDTRIETHNDFIDLQYTFDGDEVYGVARTLIPVTEYDPEKDRTFFRTEDEIDYVPSKPDRFFLYFPGENHQPSVATTENPGTSRKVVGKIEYAR